MITVAEAHARLAAVPATPRAERVRFDEALGRVLAEPLVSPFPLPRHDNSAMDGYALRAGDVAAASAESPVKLRVVGVSAAGRPLATPLEAGCCAQVMTGALLPPGADAVVMVEQTGGYDEAEATILRAVESGANIRRCGEELAKGAPVLAAGTRLEPGELGAVIGLGCAEPRVWARPTVALLATGDELREPGEELAPGDVYNSNLHVLSAVCRLLGADVVSCEVLRDDPAELARFLDPAGRRCDIVCASGGVSMGRFDHVRDVLAKLGAEPLFWKVAQKPGKPLYVARFAGEQSRARLFFGLPGNPISTFTCFVEYVAPRIAALCGRRAGQARKISARLVAPFPRLRDTHRFLFGRLALGAGGLEAEPSERQGSHMGSAALAANALLEAEPGPRPLAIGDAIVATALPWASLTSALAAAASLAESEVDDE